jgi:26S proteasome regulatory subunit N9
LSADPQTHITFLTSLLSRIDIEKHQEAHVLLLATIAHAKLLYGDLEGTKIDMDKAWKVLDQLSGVDNAVNAAYYGVAADYFKVYTSAHEFIFFGVLYFYVMCRQKQSMHRTTEILCYTWPV